MYNTAHSTVLFHNQGDYYNSRILQAERDTWHDWFAFPSLCYYKICLHRGSILLPTSWVAGTKH